MTFLYLLPAFNTKAKLAPAFNKGFKTLVFIAIFLDKVGVFYNQRHLTAFPVMRKSVESIIVLEISN